MNDVHYSSLKHDWETPHALFAALNAEFRFRLDAAATRENAKCLLFYSPENDALTQAWSGPVFCNPPYGPGIGKWVRKGFEQAQRGETVVMLIPARTCTAWWHDYVMNAREVRLIRGRLYFRDKDNAASINAPFPSCVVVFKQGLHLPRFSSMDRILDADVVKHHVTGEATR